MPRLWPILLLAACHRLALIPPPPPARPASVPELPTTGGSGGALGEVDGTHALGEQSGDFTLWAPPDANEYAHGVLALFHADDGTPRHPTHRPRLRHLAKDLGLLLVAVQSPGPVDSGCWWSPHKQLRADYLVDLLQTEVFARYDVDPERVYLAGKSGGAFWASGVPFYRDLLFYGGIIGICGGDVPRQESDVDWCAISETEDDPPMTMDPTRGAAVAARWRLFLAHTSGDPWVQNNDEAAALYGDLGGSVAHIVTGPGGHCALNTLFWLETGVRWADGD